jgi:hypothetical protein
MPNGPFVIRDPSIKINAVDLSDHVAEVSVEMTAADVDITASGSGGHQRLLGIRDDQFVLSMFSDFATAKVDATLWPLFSGGSYFLVEVWASGTATAANNPKFSGTCILTTYSPISGAIGDAARTPINLPVNGIISRATS